VSAITVSIISAVVFCFVYGFNDGQSLGVVVDNFRNVVLVVSIIMGFAGKHKSAAIISIITALITMGFITILLYL
jgi:hypothetical protein